MLLLQVMQIDTIHVATEMQFLLMMNVSQYWSGKLGLGSKPRSAMLVSTLSFGLSLDPSCLGKHIFTVPSLSGRVAQVVQAFKPGFEDFFQFMRIFEDFCGLKG